MSTQSHVARPITRTFTAAVLLAPFALADGITPVTQDRSVSSFVINPRCQPSSGSDTESATDFGPYDGSSIFELECGGALGRHTASQHSQINRLAILSNGSARSQAEADSSVVIHAIGYDQFEVTFTLDQPANCTLTADLRAAMDGPIGQSASAGVTLIGPGDLPIFSRVAQAPLGGEDLDAFSEAFALEPGTYRLRAGATAMIDSTVPPGGGGAAEYQLRFSLADRCPTDIDGNGVVELADLARLLAEFGCASIACLADVDESGGTDLADLAMLLSDFGQSCP